MNDILIRHIDKKLKSTETESLEQLVYILAKLSLVSAPAAWLVKSTLNQGDIPCLTRERALELLYECGGDKSYILPLYTVLKADVVAVNNIPTLKLSMRSIKN
ncbi:MULTISPECIES: hypothetical protein [unclassified Pantoea]|uniref:hypothetical protein n=1 Tax=unclassified Pantoea TaxID=2630326 RepID=UPI00301C48DF